MAYLARPIRTLPRLLPSCQCRFFACTRPSLADTVLPKLRDDLKVAMRAKDTLRLSVLRSLLADITNASKTTAPISNDLQLLALLKKRIHSSSAAAQEFRAAKREDIAEKEEAQVRVMEEYAAGVETVNERDVEDAVKAAVEKLKAEGTKLEIGGLIKDLLGPGGGLEGKPVQKGDVARFAKQLIAA